MDIFGSPNLTIFVFVPDLTYTADFFGPFGVLNGLFSVTVLPL
jgi:hypothetical protein